MAPFSLPCAGWACALPLLLVATSTVAALSPLPHCAHGLGPCHPASPVPFHHAFAAWPARQQTLNRVLGPSYTEAAMHRLVNNATRTSHTRVYSPVAYGADASGQTDSSLALQRTVDAMLADALPSINGSAPSGFKDLGGAVLDLAGGTYLISQPLVLPTGLYNLNVEGGLLRAGPGFPSDGTLLQIGGGAVKGEGVINLAVRRLTLDGAGLAATTLAVLNGQYVNLGPALLVYGFTAFGLRMDGTGGGFIQNSWFGEIMPGPAPSFGTDSDALRRKLPGNTTCVSLEGTEHDCYMQDVIIYSGRVGIRSQNGANTFSHVHTWNLATADGGVGILIEGGKGHVVDCYVDFAALMVVDPSSVVISETFFLGTANIVLVGSQSSAVTNLLITNNRWQSESREHNDTIVLHGSPFSQVFDSVIENNVVDSYLRMRSTRATLTVPVPSEATEVHVDFSDALLFPGVVITEASCSLTVSSGAPVAYALRPVLPHAPLHLTVALAGAVAGSLTCTVDQSARRQPGH